MIFHFLGKEIKVLLALLIAYSQKNYSLWSIKSRYILEKKRYRSISEQDIRAEEWKIIIQKRQSF